MDELELSPEEAAPLFGVSSRTLKRYLKKSRLNSRVSDVLARYLRLYDRAVHAFRSKEAAAGWFKRPHVHFDYTTPLEMMRYDPGAEAVEDIIGAIKHGVYF
jgi:putative toxin-antitoxin system antitoxin component (TIGR02293 family)